MLKKAAAKDMPFNPKRLTFDFLLIRAAAGGSSISEGHVTPEHFLFLTAVDSSGLGGLK